MISNPQHLEILKNVVSGTPTQHSTDAVNQALRCVANALLLHEAGRKAWVDLGGGELVLSDLQKSLSGERLFLDARILFLITFKPTPFIPLSIKQGGVIDKLATALSTSFHALKTAQPFGNEALIDLLKVTFNLMTHYPRMDNTDESLDGSHSVLGDAWDNKFECLVPYLLRILAELPSTSPPLQPPMTHLLHVLIHVPASLLYKPTTVKSSGIPPIAHQETAASLEDFDILQRLYFLLETVLQYYVEYEPDDLRVRTKCREKGVVLDDLVSPLPIIIIRLVKEDDEARARMLQWVLPQDLDRSQPLERRTDILGIFIRMMVSTHHPHLKATISEMLFCLCNQDAAELNAQIGYGNAAGFLYSKGIMIAPTPAHDAKGNLLHPITATNVPLATGRGDSVEMTGEEKEREAERLFVLFDRLERSGLSVNPIRKARQDGKFQ